MVFRPLVSGTAVPLFPTDIIDMDSISYLVCSALGGSSCQSPEGGLYTAAVWHVYDSFSLLQGRVTHYYTTPCTSVLERAVLFLLFYSLAAALLLLLYYYCCMVIYDI